MFRESRRPRLDRKIRAEAQAPLQCTALLEAPSARDVPAMLGQLEPTRPEKWNPWLSHLIEE